jgi:hypothetical protein
LTISFAKAYLRGKKSSPEKNPKEEE